MKAKKPALVSSAFVLLGAFVLGTYTAEMNVSAEGAATVESATTDYKAFKIRGEYRFCLRGRQFPYLYRRMEWQFCRNRSIRHKIRQLLIEDPCLQC